MKPDDMEPIFVVLWILCITAGIIWCVAVLLLYGLCRYLGISFKKQAKLAFFEMLEKYSK